MLIIKIKSLSYEIIFFVMFLAKENAISARKEEVARALNKKSKS